MRIGIDAKWYFSGNPSGQVVVRNIVDNILTLDNTHHFVLFFHKRDKKLAAGLEEVCKHKSNISIVYCFSLVNFLSNIFVLPFYARKHKVQVCLYQNFTPFLFYKRIKNVVYIHDFLFLDYPQYYTWIELVVFRLMKWTSSFARKVITISESEKERISKHIGRKNEIHVVYHGISDKFSDLKNNNDFIIRKFNLPNKYILYVGRINVRKNILLLLEAMPQINIDLPLVIIGKKDHKTFDIEMEIKRLNLEGKVHLLDHIEFNDLTYIMANSYLFVFPSLAEGFGLPPLEAMKSGVPVLVSKISCLPEICGDSALYFDPYDKQSLVDQINLLNSDKELYSSLRQKGLKHATKFKWNTSTKNIINILTS